MERGKEREEAWSFDGASENKRTVAKDSEENKENLMLSSELKDDLLLYQDEEALNDSVISGKEGEGRGRDISQGCVTHSHAEAGTFLLAGKGPSRVSALKRWNGAFPWKVSSSLEV